MASSDEEEEDVSMHESDSEEDKQNDQLQLKLKNEILVTSGCGKHREKVRILGAFWNVMWPALEQIGWTKEDGKEKDEGIIFFKPPDADGETLDRIKLVIDRVLERTNFEEAKIADTYEKHLEDKIAQSVAAAASSLKPSKPGPKDAVLPISRNARKDRTPPSNKSMPPPTTAKSPNMLEDSWKEGGRNFPKRSSSIGNRYQVSKIPEAGTFEECSDVYCSLIWNPEKATEKEINLDDVIDSLPSNIKETALFKLAELEYDVEAFESIVKTLKPTDGSNWTPERRNKFRDEIFRSRKDLTAVCRAMRIPMKTCLAYYLGTFKFADDYRVLKTVCLEEYKMRMEANEFEYDACAICGDGGNLLICDGCEGEYHMECCRPGLRTVPEGFWLCDECVDRKFLAARQYLIQKSQLFEKYQDNKRSLDDMQQESSSTLPTGVEKVVFRPTESVLAAVRTFAQDLNRVLSTGKVVDKPKEEDVAVTI